MAKSKQSTLDNLLNATSLNGDELKQKWSNMLTPRLQTEAGAIVTLVHDLILKFAGGSTEFQRNIREGETTKRMAQSVYVSVTQYNFSKRLGAALQPFVEGLASIYTGFADTVYVAASVSLVEGFNQQLKGDPDLIGAQLVFETTESDAIKLSDLIIGGLLIDSYLKLRILHIFSNQWFALVLSRAISAQPTPEMVFQFIWQLVKGQTNNLIKDLIKIEFGVAHFAVRKATMQFSNMDIEVHDNAIIA